MNIQPRPLPSETITGLVPPLAGFPFFAHADRFPFQPDAAAYSAANAWWLADASFLVYGTADFIDTDLDGLNNWQEWRAQTDPTNALSVLKMLSLSNAPSGPTVTWQSVSGVNYVLERSTLWGTAPFSQVESNLMGQGGVTSYTDTNAPEAGPLFYRVGAE